AFFTVTKDKTRPFIVETPAGAVRVTGTVFNVRADSSSSLEVLVVEGAVQVRPGEAASGRAPAPFLLGPGDRLTAGAGHVSVQPLSASAMDDALAWRHGQIVFDGVPLRDALARFARYHGRGITASPAVANLRVGGRYGLDDLDAFLTALEVVLPVRVSRDLNGTVQVSAIEQAPPSPGHGDQ
ncbi:MAG: FecR domain-containing protein, partial [Opitutaceae bacterium]